MPAAQVDASAASNDAAGPDFTISLERVRADDWLFGVSATSADGTESPVASAVPGGGFAPLVKD